MKSKISRLMFDRYANHDPVFPEYNPNADFEWIKKNSQLPWLKLDIDVPRQVIEQEITNIKPFLVQHREDYGEHNGWWSFCIHGKSHDATRESGYYNDDRPYQWTDIAKKHMPETVAYFRDQWPGLDYRRIRVMALEPGGFIALHRDREDPGLGPINIAITQPQDCRFVMDRYGTVPFSPGQAFWLDISLMHTIFNDSDQIRYHIIVHQGLDHPKFQKLVVKSYDSMYNDTICDKPL